MTRIFPAALAAIVLVAPVSFAGDDDLLAPLTTSPDAAKAKKKKPAAASTTGKLVVKTPGVKGVRLFVDEQEQAHNIGTLELSPGTHQVVVRRNGYADFWKQITVKSGQTLELIANLEPTSGTLAIESSPEGAQVFVEGRSMGQTPLRDIVLLGGSYEIRLVKEGFRDEQIKVALRPGKEQHVRVSLKGAGFEDVFGSPLKTELSPSRSAIVTQPQTLGASTPSVDLAKSPNPKPWYGRWYVWAGAGAVVVTTAAIILANNTPTARWSEQQSCGVNNRCVVMQGLSIPR